MTHQYLLNNVSVDTTGSAVMMDGAEKIVEVYIGSGGSFGGGDIVIEKLSEDGQAWIPLDYNDLPFAFSAAGVKNINFIPSGNSIRAVMTGSTGASKVYARVC